jgi:hypothetical protein
MRHILLSVALLGLLGMAPARATLVDPGAFTAAGPAITFGTDTDAGTVNPSYAVGGVTVSFGGYFQGQSVDAGFPPLLSGAPTPPLVLSGSAVILADVTNPASPVLVGQDAIGANDYAPIAVLFSQGVNAVAFRLGELEELGGVRIEAFGADGASLGTLVSSALGFETIRFAHGGGTPIRGFTVSLTNNPTEPSFGIDDLTFAGERVVVVPAPATALLLLTALPVLMLARRRAVG